MEREQAATQGVSRRGKPNNSSLLLSARPSAVKKKKRLLLALPPALLFLHQRKDFSFGEWNELREKKRTSLSQMLVQRLI